MYRLCAVYSLHSLALALERSQHESNHLFASVEMRTRARTRPDPEFIVH